MTGKKIFDDLVQYPLPQRTGVVDYVVYVFKKTGDFSKHAKIFFDRFYPKHVPLTATSLEGTIKAIHAHAAAHGVTQIRELVIVAHGAATELYPQVIEDLSDSTDTSFACITEYSLASLQAVFQQGAVFTSFRDARRAVCALLKDDSWVTIRACNVGQSRPLLYALFVFFGGKANVYAPTEYMVFARIAVEPGARIASDVGVYDHLRKQHFLATDEHTPERKSKIVAALVDPASFAVPVEVAKVNSGASDQAVEAFAALRLALDRRKVPDEIRTKLDAAGHTLTPRAKVLVDSQGSRWKIIDSTVDEQNEPLQIQFVILDLDDSTGEWLEARPQVADASSARIQLPIQLLMDQTTHDDFMGRLFVVASYLDDGVEAEDNANKAKLDALAAQLDGAQHFTDLPADLQGEFQDGFAAKGAAVDVSTAAMTVTKAGSKWHVASTPPLFLERDTLGQANGPDLHGIFVYYDRTPEQMKLHQLDVLAQTSLGPSDPDTPGVELPAYLDRFSREQLLAFMEHLRTPFRAMNAFFLQHAAEALGRKVHKVISDADAAAPLALDLMLDGSENDAYAASSYSFEFNQHWSEVRASSTHPTTFTTDPFEDPNQLLTKTLKLTGSGPTCDGQDPESPSVDVNDLRDSEQKGREKYFKNHGGKDGWPTVIQPDADCADFAKALDTIKELQAEGKTPPEIKAALEAIASSTAGKSLLDKITDVYDGLSFAKGLASPVFESELLSKLFNAADVAELFLKGDFTAESWIEVGLSDFAGEAAGLTMTAIAVPMYLYSHVMSQWDQADQNDQDMGELTAFRWWCYQLDDLASSGPLPEHVSINLGSDQAAAMNAYWHVYLRDRGEGIRPGFEPTMSAQFVESPSDLKDGYLKGVAIMDRVGPQLIANADRYISDAIDRLPMDPCKLKHLRDAGFIDFDGLRALVVRKIAEALLDKLPTVLGQAA